MECKMSNGKKQKPNTPLLSTFSSPQINQPKALWTTSKSISIKFKAHGLTSGLEQTSHHDADSLQKVGKNIAENP
jgi:hypothetical protein